MILLVSKLLNSVEIQNGGWMAHPPGAVVDGSGCRGSGLLLVSMLLYSTIGLWDAHGLQQEKVVGCAIWSACGNNSPVSI